MAAITWHKRINQGKCASCGLISPIKNKRSCLRCLKDQRKVCRNRYKRMKENGICTSCHTIPALITTLKCENCYFRFISYHNLGTKKKWEEIKELFYEQNGICPLSGRKLTIGINTSLDHIIPSSKQGSDNVSNLRWVHYRVNIAKNNLSDDELLTLIKDLYIHMNLGGT